MHLPLLSTWAISLMQRVTAGRKGNCLGIITSECVFIQQGAHELIALVFTSIMRLAPKWPLQGSCEDIHLITLHTNELIINNNTS